MLAYQRNRRVAGSLRPGNHAIQLADPGGDPVGVVEHFITATGFPTDETANAVP
jgi:hypothetical protein